MSQDYRLPLLRVLNIYLFLSLITSAAVVVPPAILSLLGPSDLITNLTTPAAIRAGGVRCVNPSIPGHVPVNFQICQPFFNAWLHSTEIDKPKLYQHIQGRLLLTGPPCIIGLEPRLLQRPIVLSLRQIIADIVVVLMVCERFGRGGWTEIDGTTWIVAVKGGVKGIGVVNRTLEDATDRSLGGVEAD